MEEWNRKTAAHDERIYRERKSKLLGTARISLSCLQFQTDESLLSLSRGKKDVEKLVRVIRVEGCYRLADDESHVSVLISPSQLEEALRRTAISIQDLSSRDVPPQLIIDPTRPLQCLHGRRRLQAAGETLSDGDDWWVVDLYTDGRDQLPRILSRILI
jgi:hypothetical protein